MLKWNESYGQWTVEKMIKRKRLFRRLPGDIGKDREADARAMAVSILAEFRLAVQESGGEPGYIYAVSNPAFPGLLKIGMTRGAPEQRCRELSMQLPTPCALEFAVAVKKTRAAESAVHRELMSVRVNPKREWFKVDVQFAAKIMARIAIEQTRQNDRSVYRRCY